MLLLLLLFFPSPSFTNLAYNKQLNLLFNHQKLSLRQWVFILYGEKSWLFVCICASKSILQVKKKLCSTSKKKTNSTIKKTGNFKQQFNATIHAKIAANRKTKIGLVEIQFVNVCTCINFIHLNFWIRYKVYHFMCVLRNIRVTTNKIEIKAK